MSRILLFVILVSACVDAFGKDIAGDLLAASCEFEGSLSGSVVTKTIQSKKVKEGTVYVYNVEACGGGNHYESYIALVKNGRVVDAKAVIDEADSIFGKPQQRKRGHVNKITVYEKGHCLEGLIQLHTKTGPLMAYYIEDNKLISYLGGC